jgi:hypothetical protein
MRVTLCARACACPWHCGSLPLTSQVDVTDPLRGTTWVFPCNRWLDAKEDDGAIERLLTPKVDATVKTEARIPYEVVFHTGDKRGAGTSANGAAGVENCSLCVCGGGGWVGG